MKKLLVPTDFSVPAFYASDAAMRLAPAMGAEVHFFSRTPGKREGTFFEAQEGDKQAPLGIQEKFQGLRERYADSSVPIKTIYSHDTLLTAIESYVEKEDISIVVMGSSGANGIKAFLRGSHAQKVVNRLDIPVMVIKHSVEEMGLSDVIFASDFRKEAQKPFLEFVEFARIFHSHIHLVHVITIDTSPVEEYLAKKKMQAFEQMVEGLECSIHFSGDVGVEVGLRNFANEHKVDLLAVCSHGEGPLERLIKGGSVAESMVMRQEIPVITFNAHTT